MALAGGWFDGSGTPDYLDVRCDADFTSASTSTTTSGSYQRVTRGPCNWLVFLPNKINDKTGTNKKDPEYGYCYATKNSDSTEVGIRNIWHSLRAGPAVSDETQENLYRPFGYTTHVVGSLITAVIPTGGSDMCSVYLYQPWAWYGRVGQVIASMLLVKGVDPDNIDQTAFSYTDDAQDAMGTADEEPFVFYRRQVGQPLGEAAKIVARCSWDILTINIDGKVAMMPRTSVPAAYTIAGLDAGDGVVHVDWRYAYEALANHCWASEGRYYQVLFETVGTFNNVVAACNEIAYPRTADDKRGLPFEEFEDSTSSTKYGVRELGRDAEIQEANEVKTIRQYHLETMCNIEGSVDGDPLESKTVLMQRLVDVESVLRREVTVVQDLRGLDYDVGYLVEDVALTGDGATFDAFCIRKTINFNDLSVTSVLLEEPS